MTAIESIPPEGAPKSIEKLPWPSPNSTLIPS